MTRPVMTDPLAPFFLGAYGENDDFFEKTLLELRTQASTAYPLFN